MSELGKFIRNRMHLWSFDEAIELLVALDALGDPETDNAPANVLHRLALALSAPDQYERDAGNVILRYIADLPNLPRSDLLTAQTARVAWQHAFGMQVTPERQDRALYRASLLDIRPESAARLLTNIGFRDLAFWESLPDTITIYRGAAGVDAATAATGLSWTTRRDVAEQIAHHRSVGANKPPILVSARVRKEDVLTIFAFQHEIVTRVSHWSEEYIDGTWRYHLPPLDWIFGAEKQDLQCHTRHGHEQAYARISDYDRQQVDSGPALTEWTFASVKTEGVELGGIYRDAFGAYWLVKSHVDPDHAASDHLASQLYRAAGASVPETRLIALGEPYGPGVALASRIVRSVPVDPTNADHLAAIQLDFAADAWLATHDMPGSDYDNVRVNPSDGCPLRVDFGGALSYRGRGERKGDNFGVTVPELTAMRDRQINPAGAAVYGSITTDRLIASADKVTSIPDATLRDLCDRHAPGTPDERATLADKLIARRDDIARQISSITQPRSDAEPA